MLTPVTSNQPITDRMPTTSETQSKTEFRDAYLEKRVLELNQTVKRQSEQIETLTARLHALLQVLKLQEIEEISDRHPPAAPRSWEVRSRTSPAAINA